MCQRTLSSSGRFFKQSSRLDDRVTDTLSVGDSTSDDSTPRNDARDNGETKDTAVAASIVPRLSRNRVEPLVGHDFTYAPYAGPNTSALGDEQIHTLLAERIQAKRRRQFDVADEIRQTLNEAGVFVFDKEKLWRADGLLFDYGRAAHGHDSRGGGARRSDVVSQLKNYRQSPDAGPSQAHRTLSDENVQRLLTERWHAKLSRNFAKADEIRHQLEADGVEFNDMTKEWRADGVGYHTNKQRTTARRSFDNDWGHDYTVSPLAGPPTTILPEAEMHQLLAERLKCKVLRDFVTADRIKEDLEDQGVYMDDRTKVYRADGVPFELGFLGKTKNFGPRGHDYTLAHDAGPNTSALSDETIHDLLKERLQAKMARQFDHADRIREAMQLQGVFVDDRQRQWRADNVDFEFVGSVGGYAEEQYEF